MVSVFLDRASLYESNFSVTRAEEEKDVPPAPQVGPDLSLRVENDL